MSIARLQHLSQLLNGLGLIPLGLERCLNVKLCHRSNSIRLLYDDGFS